MNLIATHNGRRTFLWLALIIIAGFLAYFGTLQDPFRFDDNIYISDSLTSKYSNFYPNNKQYLYPNIMDFQAFITGARANDMNPALSYHRYYITRFVGYLSLLVNFRLVGYTVLWYHVVNLIIHLANAILIFYMFELIARIPSVETGLSPKRVNTGAFIASIFFVSHPLGTEAVTYIAQRFVVLATFFYLLTLVLFIRARSMDTGKARTAIYMMSLCSAALAMTTKEISFTLPFVILLSDFLFFKDPPRKRLLLLPFFIVMTIIPAAYLIESSTRGGLMEGALKLQTDISRTDYLFTQFRVIVTYLRLLVLPINQNIDYDYPLYTSFLAAPVLLSFFLLFSTVCFLIAVIIISKKMEHKLIVFGLAWFFITLSIESSVIPISQYCVEYRAYLPLVGPSIALSVPLSSLLGKARYISPWYQRMVIVSLIVSALVLITATYQRNHIWKDDITLWEDSVRKSPNSARAHYSLAREYLNSGHAKKAIEEFMVAIQLDPENALYYYSLGKSHYEANLLDNSMESMRTALKLSPDFPDPYIWIGKIKLKRGHLEDAIIAIHKGLEINPASGKGHYYLGIAYMLMKDYSRAIEHLERSIELESSVPNAYYNLGLAYASIDAPDQAMTAYEKALELKPDYIQAHLALADVYAKGGKMDKAREHRQLAARFRKKG